MSETVPGKAGDVAGKFPEVWEAYSSLGKACAESGPLDARTRRLIKLAMAIGAGSEGAVHSHARQAVEEGEDVAALHQVSLLAITTLGFPRAIAALSWIEDITDED